MAGGDQLAGGAAEIRQGFLPGIDLFSFRAGNFKRAQVSLGRGDAPFLVFPDQALEMNRLPGAVDAPLGEDLALEAADLLPGPDLPDPLGFEAVCGLQLNVGDIVVRCRPAGRPVVPGPPAVSPATVGRIFQGPALPTRGAEK